MKNLLIILFMLICVTSGAQTFERNYPYWEEGSGDKVFTYDDGYAMVGFASNSYQENYLYIIRTNLHGDTLWTKRTDFGTLYSLPYISSYTIDNMGNIYLSPVHTGTADLIKMSPDWDVIWMKQLSPEILIQQIIFSNDANLLLTGKDANGKHRLCKFDPEGNFIWQSVILNHDNMQTYRYSPSILEMNDNRIVLISVLSGMFGSFVSSDVFTFSMNGDSISYAHFSGRILCDTYLYDNELFSLYHSTGATLQFLNFLIRFLPDGTILWEKELAMAKTCYSYRFLPVNGDKLIAVGVNGYTEPINQVDGVQLNTVGIKGLYEPLRQIFLHEMTINGDSLWTSYFGDSHEIWPWDVKQCSDNGFVISGVSEISANYTPLLIKTDSTGNISNVGINNDPVKSRVTVYPNPANEYVVFDVTTETRHVVSLPTNLQTIAINDIYGRKVAEVPVTGDKTVWDTKGVAPGVYMFEFGNGNSFSSGKFVIAR